MTTTVADMTAEEIAQAQAMWAAMGNTSPMTAGQLKTLRVHTLIAQQNITVGTRVFVRYEAFNEATQRQIEMAAPARQLGISPEEYTGFFDGLHFNKKTGEAYIRLRGISERLVEVDAETNFRNFNLVQGTVQEIRFLSAAPVQSQ